jgi:hypothetical protein
MKITAAIRNTQNDVVCDQLDSGGLLRIYSGTRPTDADTALSGNTLLAELAFSSTAFPASSSGSAAANAITQDSSANATGTASFVRCVKADGTTVVADLSVGVGSGELQLNTLSIVSGLPVQVTALTFTTPVGS